MRNETVYLQHILEAINQIEQYVEDKTSDDFRQTRLLQDGVVRRLEIIGEAARYLPDSLHQAYPEVPWRQMVGMRNRMIHEYFNVDLTVVWEVTQNDISTLKEKN